MKSSDLHADIAFESINYTGEWWVPGMQGQKCFGTLYVTPKENLQKLVLLGMFEGNAFQMWMKYPIIQGRVSKGSGITIFDAICIGKSTSLNTSDLSETTISFSEMWIGPGFFECQDDIKLEKISFGINNLGQWHNQQSFKYEHQDNSMKYNHPEELFLYEDSLVRITLGYKYCTNISIENASFEQDARIYIKSKQGKLPFYGQQQSFQYYSNMIYSFFSLLIGISPFMYDCVGIAQSAVFTNGNFEQQEEAYARIWRRFLPKEMPKRITFMDIPFPYKAVQEHLRAIVSKYAERYAAIDGFGEFVFKLVNSQQIHQYDDSSLPEMFYLLEGLMKKLYKPEIIEQHKKLEPFDEFEEKRSQILTVCPLALKNWLNDKLYPYPIGKDIIAAALPIAIGVFSFITEEKYNQIFKYIKTTRDHYSHGVTDRIENWELYIPVTMWIRQLITALILQKSDCSMDMIKTCYKQNINTNELSQTLPMLLSTMENKK